MKAIRKWFGIGLGALILLALLIQLVPYGRNHTNPPVVKEFNWASPAAKQVAQRACYDCHSNQTVWPWYSSVAPISWMVTRHVNEGRQAFNFSDWKGAVRNEEGRVEEGTDDMVDAVRNSEMPPASYLLIHGNAHLTSTERQTLIAALEAVALAR